MTLRTEATLARSDAFWLAVGGTALQQWLEVRPKIAVIKTVSTEDFPELSAGEGRRLRVVDAADESSLFYPQRP